MNAHGTSHAPAGGPPPSPVESIAMSQPRRISVIGLGYVGLPVAVAFAGRGVPVVAFDIAPDRVAELRAATTVPAR